MWLFFHKSFDNKCSTSSRSIVVGLFLVWILSTSHLVFWVKFHYSSASYIGYTNQYVNHKNWLLIIDNYWFSGEWIFQMKQFFIPWFLRGEVAISLYMLLNCNASYKSFIGITNTGKLVELMVDIWKHIGFFATD